MIIEEKMVIETKRIRPKIHLELYEDITNKLSKSPEIKYFSYKQKLNYADQVLCYLIKQLETKRSEIDIEDKYYGILGKVVLNEDIGNLYNDNSFDALITSKNRNRITQINFKNEVITINWKNVQPTGKTKEVSLSPYLVDKYYKEQVNVVFLIKNSSDPNYYVNSNNMYFPDNKITTEGFQYYIIPYYNLYLGKIKTYGNYYYEVKSNGIMMNMGLRFKNNQLNLNDRYDKGI